MVLYFNRALGYFESTFNGAQPLRNPTFKRGDTIPLSIVLHSNSTPAPLQEGYELKAILKARPGNNPALALVAEWTAGTHPTLPGALPTYSADLNLNGAALETLIGSSTAVQAYFEITFADSATPRSSSRLMPVSIENDLYRGDESAPEPSPTSLDWLDEHAIRFDTEQSLSPEQQAQARDNIGAGTGGPGFEIHDISTNDEKYDIAGLVPGYTIRVTNEAGRIEQYIGPVSPDSLQQAVRVFRSDLPGGELLLLPVIGVYGGLPQWKSPDPAYPLVLWALGGSWGLANYGSPVYGPSISGVPWGSGWPVGTTVEAVPAAHFANWITLGPNTFEVLISKSSSISVFVVNGVQAIDDTDLSIGWVKENEELLVETSGLISRPQVELVEYRSTISYYGSDTKVIYVPYFRSGQLTFALTIPNFPGARVVRLFDIGSYSIP